MSISKAPSLQQAIATTTVAGGVEAVELSIPNTTVAANVSEMQIPNTQLVLPTAGTWWIFGSCLWDFRNADSMAQFELRHATSGITIGEPLAEAHSDDAWEDGETQQAEVGNDYISLTITDPLTTNVFIVRGDDISNTVRAPNGEIFALRIA